MGASVPLDGGKDDDAQDKNGTALFVVYGDHVRLFRHRLLCVLHDLEGLASFLEKKS